MMTRSQWAGSLLSVVVLVSAACQDTEAPQEPRTIIPSTAVAPGTVIPVAASVDSLYAAVNNPGYAGAVLQLAAFEYRLDSLRPNDGRLELQAGMSLRGTVGNRSATIINAKGLAVSNHLPSGTNPTTGTLRLGRGTQAVEWLTIKNSTGTAAIEMDLAWVIPPNVTVSHVEVDSSRRGIDVRNAGAASAGRVLVATIRDSYVHNSSGSAGQGIRVVNQAQANGAVILATFERNILSGNRVGAFAGNAAVAAATISLSSTDDRYENGGVGFGAVGGVGAASSNTVSVSMLRPAFIGNTGAVPSGFTMRAGLSAEGGSTSAAADVASFNTAAISIILPTFSGNCGVAGACPTGSPAGFADVRAYGARSTTANPAGMFNTASIAMVAGTPNPLVFKTSSEPVQTPATNIVSVVP